MQQITPELLARYYEGRADENERRAVEAWLASEEIGTIPPFPVHADEQMVQQKMWQDISATMQPARMGRSIPFRTWAQAAAACLVISSGIWMVREKPYLLSYKLEIDNRNQQAEKVFRYKDLHLTIAPNSRCEIEVPVFGAESRISFCGAVAVENRAGESRRFQISRNDYTKEASDLVRLRKGQTYLMMTDDTYSMVAATTDEIIDGIPRPFSTRLIETFNLSI